LADKKEIKQKGIVVYYIGLLGLGTVGRGTFEILSDPAGRNPLLSEMIVKKVGVRSIEKHRALQLNPQVLTQDLDSIVNDPEISIVVELLGGLEPARSLILKAIKAGKHVVTANKAVIARYREEIYAAAQEKGVYVLIEGAVGGGIPIIKPLKQSLGSNRIQSIIGIVNGTTNYILTQMSENGADFADVLSKAQQLGYAEANPSSDVDGLDAADKISILASLGFGGHIKREDVYGEGIRNITATDINYARRLGYVIKLLAIARGNAGEDSDRLELRVHPTLVPQSHPLASINGVNNAILVEGDPLGQVMFYGPGAGSGPTASAVVSDIMNIVAILKSHGSGATLDPLLSRTHQHYCQITPIEEIESSFYTRLITLDRPGAIGQIGTCFGENNVSLQSLVQIGLEAGQAELVVVSHNVKEQFFRQALESIKQLEAIKSIPSVIRVLE